MQDSIWYILVALLVALVFGFFLDWKIGVLLFIVALFSPFLFYVSVFGLILALFFLGLSGAMNFNSPLMGWAKGSC